VDVYRGGTTASGDGPRAVYGMSVRLGAHGVPPIGRFGNVRQNAGREAIVDETRDPIVDVLDVSDAASRRRGGFDHVIDIGAPDEQERRPILSVRTAVARGRRAWRLGLSRATHGFTGGGTGAPAPRRDKRRRGNSSPPTEVRRGI
jgi:hypothetical protein